MPCSLATKLTLNLVFTFGEFQVENECTDSILICIWNKKVLQSSDLIFVCLHTHVELFWKEWDMQKIHIVTELCWLLFLLHFLHFFLFLVILFFKSSNCSSNLDYFKKASCQVPFFFFHFLFFSLFFFSFSFFNFPARKYSQSFLYV